MFGLQQQQQKHESLLSDGSVNACTHVCVALLMLVLLEQSWMYVLSRVLFCACRKVVEEEPDPEQIAKDLERLEMIKKKRSVQAPGNPDERQTPCRGCNKHAHSTGCGALVSYAALRC